MKTPAPPPPLTSAPGWDTNDNKEADPGVYTYRLTYENGVKSGFFHLIR